MNIINPYTPEIATQKAYLPHLFTIIALAACGIALATWPFLGAQKYEISSWIERHRGLIGVVLLLAISVGASLIKKLAERDELIHVRSESGSYKSD